jgi:hypothetical protein
LGSKILFVGLMGVAAAVGCGARDSIQSSSSPAAGGASAAGGAPADAGDGGDANSASDADDSGLTGPAPVPTCHGMNSACVLNDAGTWLGSAVIVCDGVYFKGPWTLLLQREVNGQWQVEQVQAIEEPGFGTTFYDMSGPPQKLTYRVCSLDKVQGTKCGDPFTTFGPVVCKCEPSTCGTLNACFRYNNDGCGTQIYCGPCGGGMACNNVTHSCCPPGKQSDGVGGCVCAPPVPCPGQTYWDTSLCSCEQIFP